MVFLLLGVSIIFLIILVRFIDIMTEGALFERLSLEQRLTAKKMKQRNQQIEEEVDEY